MAWTKDDIPTLQERRANLKGMIAHHESGHPATIKEHGKLVSDPVADLADLKAKLDEVEGRLVKLGVNLDA